MKKHHILVLGTGSVGRRHAKNFQALNCDISCMDPREDRLDEAAKEGVLQFRFSDLGTALEKANQFTGVVVCSPPAYHVDQALACLDKGLPVLLEKPVSPDAESCRKLSKRLEMGGRLLLGYTYRWWKPLRRLKQLIESDAVGNLRHARFVMSAHLEDWHPWERYQDFFMASQDLGGGALLDESHFIDLMLWFFGSPERLFARVEKISDLDITTDDYVEIFAAYPRGFRSTIHLDLFGRPHEKTITVVGEKGTVQCLFSPDEVRIANTPSAEWMREPFVVERNDMFLDVAKEFLQLIQEESIPLSCTILDGLKTLNVVEACRESQQLGQEVSLSRNEG
jgi:predicted dehydrogenase